MNDILKILKKYYITIWLVTAFIILSLVVYGEYSDERNRVKRVAANVSSDGQLFSSNCLYPGEIFLKKVAVTAQNGYCVVPVRIFNYSATNPTKAYQGELPYKLTIKLVNSQDTVIAENGLNGFTVELSEDGTNYTSIAWNATKGCYYAEYNKTFNTVSNGVYVPEYKEVYVRFPASVLTNDPGIYAEMIATPSDTKSFSPIKAIVGVQPQATTIVRGWKGDLYDEREYYDYDAFNYVITGNGAATITLEWCADYLEMNDVNLDEYSDDIDLSESDLVGTTKTIGNVNGVWKKIVIDADADREDLQGNVIGRNRYGFQFYMTADPSADYGYSSGATIFWQTVGSYISFSME